MSSHPSCATNAIGHPPANCSLYCHSSIVLLQLATMSGQATNRHLLLCSSFRLRSEANFFLLNRLNPPLSMASWPPQFLYLVSGVSNCPDTSGDPDFASILAGDVSTRNFILSYPQCKPQRSNLETQIALLEPIVSSVVTNRNAPCSFTGPCGDEQVALLSEKRLPSLL